MADSSEDYLAHHAAVAGDRVALVDDADHCITFAELNLSANRWADCLGGLAVGPGDVCLHVHRNRLEAFELFHGLRKLGALSVPQSPATHPGELAALLADSRARVVIAEPSAVPLLDTALAGLSLDARPRLIVLGQDSAPGWPSSESLLRGAREDRPATGSIADIAPTLAYTSGTSGVPKGVFRRRGLSPEAISSGLRTLGMGPTNVHLMAGPGHTSGPWGFATLQQLIGATCVVLRGFDPRRALEMITRHRVTSTYLLPALVKRIIDLPAETREGFDVASLEMILVSGAPFRAADKSRALDYFGDCLYESYGSTETGMITFIGPAEMRRKPASCGRPLQGVDIRLLDEDGKSVPTDEHGLLWARSSSLFDGYYHQPGITEQWSPDGFFAPGDIASADADGYLYIHDRIADVINMGGTKIHPGEVESALSAHPDVADCAVVGVPDADFGESIKAVVRRSAGSTADAEKLLAHCARLLAPLKVPWSIDFSDEIPRDAAGKLLRRQVRDRYRKAH